MSKGPSPTAIGSFVISGLVLAIGAAIYFGSVSFSSGDPQFVMFFDESVAGLAEGAKVKLRGVPIGVVKRITLRLPNQADTDQRIPVFVEIHTDALRRLGALTDVSDYDLDESLKRAVERGLRGRLQMESLITGMYYVELDFEPDPAPPAYAQDPQQVEHKEIPTLPSQFAAIGRTASDMATQIATIPFNELSDHMLSLVKSIDLILAELRERELVDTVADTLEAVRDQVQEISIGETLAELQTTIQHLNKLLVQAEQQLDPVSKDIRAIVAELKKTLESMQSGMGAVTRAGDQIDAALSPDSTLRFQIEQAMAELANAADAIARLADQLERNPSAVVRGKAIKETSR